MSSKMMNQLLKSSLKNIKPPKKQASKSSKPLFFWVKIAQLFFTFD